MEKKIIELSENDRTAQLTQLLGQLKEKEIKEILERCMLRGKSDPFALISAVFQGSAVSSKDGVHRRLIVYRHCIALLQKNEMNPKTAASLVGLLMLEADALPGSCLVELCNMFLDAVKNEKAAGGKAWDLFPKLLSAISVQDTIVFDENTLKGSEYKSQVLNSLCSSRWSSRSVIPLAAMFRDMPLTNDELKFVIEKIVRLFSDLALQDVPAVVYQLSMLSTKGHKRLVLEGISEFFMAQDKLFQGRSEPESMDLLDCDSQNVDILRQTEGTVILHITFSIKQDQDLGKEYLKYLKSSQNISLTLSPFVLALSLSIARIQRFEEQVFDFIRSTIIKYFKDQSKLKCSKWIREISSEDCSVEKQILETVQNSKFGWDHVIQGLVDLGFSLMDSYGPKAAFGRIDNLPVHPSGPSHDACQLGAKILIDTFKAHESVRIEILDQIFNRVVTKATSPVVHYLELLSNTVISAPQILLESVPKVRETFDYLSMLPVTSAVRLMKAIQPLLKFSISLKDALIIVLRKAMFSRQLDARKIGVSGFLMILKHFKVIGGLPSSQGSQSFSFSQVQVHCSHNPGSNEALCLEILGNLRRCLTQQADVRLTLYEGIYDVLCRNSQLGGPILDILFVQLKKYYEPSNDVNPPLKLNSCIIAQGEQVYLTEPLGHLLSCINHCIRKVREFKKDQNVSDYSDDDDDNASYTSLEEILTFLTERMIKCEMEDFELDKSADFSLSSTVGVRNNIFAILLMGTYEVLMEHTYTMGDCSLDSCEQILELHANYKKISDILRQKAAAAGSAKKGKTTTNKPAISLLSTGFLTSVVQALFQDTLPQHQEGADHLKSSLDFMKYIMQISQQKIQQLQSKGTCDGVEGGDKNKVFQYISGLGRILLMYYTDNYAATSVRSEKRKQVVSLCLECLQGIFTFVCNNNAGQLGQFLRNVDSTGELDQRDEQKNLYTYVRKFQKIVVSILCNTDDDDEEVNVKEVGSLLNIIALLGKFIDTENAHYEKLQNWTMKICTEKNIDDLAVCKQLLQMLILTTRQLRSPLSILRDFSQDVHCKAGDIDEDVELEDKTHFEIVTIRSSTPTVLLAVLHALSEEMDDTEWGIHQMKADIQTNAKVIVDSSQILTQRENQEKSVCIRLGMTVNCFHELVQCVIPAGTCVESMFREVTKLYTTLTLLVKFYLTMYTLKVGHLSSRFEKLVKLSGTHLTQKVYSMINYMQNTESEALQQNVDKVKKDKKKISSVVQAGKAKVLKQTRLIPNLIFAIEQYERYLIQLSKKSKVNLMEHMKLSTSRDFRINAEALKRLDEEKSSEESSDEKEDEENSDSESEQENQPPTQEDQRPNEPAKENSTEQPTAKKRKIALGNKSKNK